VNTFSKERPYLLDVAADLLMPLEEAAFLVRRDARVCALPLVVRELFLEAGYETTERIALYEDLAAIWHELPLPGLYHGALTRALALDTGLPFDERARIVTMLVATGAGDDRLRPLVESMIFERTDSLDLLAAAGVPDRLLRDPHRP
ncbi:hypothetical protein JYK22_27510, partial [Nonomuraea sp. RK-328]|nr:hypothetical protein [Nonomuraea sp. RK-328]